MLENSPLHKAILKWIEINGVQPPDENGRWKGSMADYDIKLCYDDLKEAMELDPSNTTAVLTMRKFMKAYAGSVTATAEEMMADPTKFISKIEAIKEINALLDIVEVNEDEQEFIAALRTQLKHFGAYERADIQALLDNPHQLARLRRDALRSMEKRLKMNQFLIGAHEPDDVRPVYVPVIHQFWNINSLLAMMANTPSGVSLNLIQDQKNGFESYFAFAIRNGGNLMILTDIPEYAHPLAADMKRRPDRDFAARAGKNWFPYELMNIEVTEEGYLNLPSRSDVKALVTTQNVNLPLKALKDIQAEDLVWITLVFDLIISKYWIRKETAAQLSYTGEMLKVSDALSWQAKMVNLPVAENMPLLELAPLTIDDISNTNLREDQVGYMGSRPHQWIEDRYRDQVSEEVLNVVAENNADMLLMDDGRIVDGKSLGIRLGRNDHFGFEYDKAVKQGAIQAVQQYVATRFGTPEQIEADRRWLARYNFAARVNALAREEFEQEKDKLRKTYFDAVEANIDNIMRWVTGKDVYLGDEAGQYAPELHRGYKIVGDKRVYRFQHFMNIAEEKKDRYSHSIYAGADIFLSKYRKDSRDWKSYCCVTGAAATYTVLFDPSTPQMIAMVMGCTVDDLPIWLQHYEATPYMKNHILDRVDPMGFVVENPATKFDPRFRLHFSKRGLKKILEQTTEMPIKGAETDDNAQWTIRVT